ncbi:hypothetical protein EDB81DRAFT_890352 [Dactylonectria macrodidyma]|uniref:NB-ARC domain-containing protein n=1 Tax=Dactylonectria macrodidyma TaxID=307937 RepID=A0A9P9DTH1_9HYPO|nr:hypothetical protein EDB81DRAFT_890352 [Dactylonectria macrodidyma]
MKPSVSSCRDVSGNQLGDNATIIQGDAHTHYHLPHQPTPAAVRAIPYPRNEDLVHRPDLVIKLNQLLPQTTESCSAALWGLGGLGEATFSQDYKTIVRKLGADKALKDEDLFAAVREYIKLQLQWVLILDNADDLALFGVGRAEGTATLFEYIPQAPAGTILWTSRDEHIMGTLVGSRRGVRVGRMAPDEATELLNMARNVEKSEDVVGTTALLEELQWLPLAIS